MGAALGRREAPSPEALAAALAEVRSWPPPAYEDGLWVASCRPLCKTNRFAQRLFLFQPDCRLFCHRGLKCHITNDLHRRLYIHCSRQAIRAAAQEDLTSRAPSTPIVSAPSGTQEDAALPFVRCCWSLETGDPADLPPALADRTVVVWVHGFSQRYFRVLAVADHLMRRLGADSASISASELASGAHTEPRPAVLAFLWPSRLKKAAYASARGATQEAASRLLVVLTTLRARGCRVVVAGHSLGCRVALQALLRPSAAEASADRTLCSHLIVLGAAVAADALEEQGEFPRSRLATGSLSVYFSSHDDTLRRYFPIGEAFSAGRLSGFLCLVGLGKGALGLAGPSGPLTEDVEAEDVSDSVSGHNPNLWFLSASVLRGLARAAGVALAAPLAAGAEGEDDQVSPNGSEGEGEAEGDEDDEDEV